MSGGIDQFVELIEIDIEALDHLGEHTLDIIAALGKHGDGQLQIDTLGKAPLASIIYIVLHWFRAPKQPTR